jgi:phenylalanyl-tRNA synthetase alpha chain
MRLIATGRALRLGRTRWSIGPISSGSRATYPLFTPVHREGLGFRSITTTKTTLQEANTATKSTIDAKSPREEKVTNVEGKAYPTDHWTNAPPNILSHIKRRIYLQENHPLDLTRKLIESQFPAPTYGNYTESFPVVSTEQNFDSLGFPPDHPGRSRTDTYYLNEKTVLRTHSSAHQADYFRRMNNDANKEDGYTVVADVYRRDAIDRSHYPVFHQMEGARLWKRPEGMTATENAARIWEDFEKLPSHGVVVEDPNPVTHPERNPLQSKYHSQEEVEAVVAHLKRTLENVFVRIFTEASKAANTPQDPLKLRWVEAYFPFTSPSLELEVFWQGDWLEVLGCGVIKQELLNNSGVPGRIGWAFGLGLERIAMLLFNIPDIRLFWSTDARFIGQFSDGKIVQFQPFSKHPECYKDVAFWLSSASTSGTGASAAGGAVPFHDNDMMEIVRNCAKDIVEDVKLVDEFVHPKTGRKSLCYRINYRSLEHTLTNKEVNDVHEKVRTSLKETMGVELR